MIFSRISPFVTAAVFLSVLLGGCAALDQKQTVAGEGTDPLSECERYAVLRNDYAPPPAVRTYPHVEPGQWDKLFQSFSEPIDPNNSLYMEKLSYLKSHPRHMEHVLKNAESFIFSVYRDVVRAGLPPEIIVIPMIESMYNPAAKSPAGYAGMWQFGSQTAKNFGLTVHGAIDERFDYMKSTGAAVRYLNYLMKFFDGSWTMAVAGYNAGEGRVLNTYRGSGKKASELDFNKLSIPLHTKRYINSIMAYAYYLKHYKQFNVRLPSAVAAAEKKRKNEPEETTAVRKSVRYVSPEEFSRIHGIELSDLGSRYHALEKRYVQDHCLCRIVLKGENEPYAASQTELNREYVISGTDHILDQSVRALEKYATVKPDKKHRKDSSKTADIRILNNEEFFSDLGSVLHDSRHKISEEVTVSAAGGDVPAAGSGNVAESTKKPVVTDPSDGSRVKADTGANIRQNKDKAADSSRTDAEGSKKDKPKTESNESSRQNIKENYGRKQDSKPETGSRQAKSENSKTNQRKTDKKNNSKPAAVSRQVKSEGTKVNQQKTDKKRNSKPEAGSRQTKSENSKTNQRKTDKKQNSKPAAGSRQVKNESSKTNQRKTDKKQNSKPATGSHQVKSEGTKVNQQKTDKKGNRQQSGKDKSGKEV